MAVQTQVVRFTKDTSGTTNATQDVTFNFTPKAIIVFSDGNSADNTVSAHYQQCFGFSDGTTSCCTTVTSDDADAATDASNTRRNDSVFVRLSETANETTLSRATCAFGTNKVTFTWAVNDTTATYISVWAIGGADITNVKCAMSQNIFTPAGNIDVTGLGFTPVDGKAVVFTLRSYSSSGNPNIVEANGIGGIGCAVSSSKQWFVSNSIDDAADPSDTNRYHSNAYISLGQGPSGAPTGQEASFVSWITDGFRVNTPSGSAFVDLIWLVINGGNWDAGNLTSPTTPTNDVDTTVSVSSNTLRGMFMASAGVTALNTTTATATFSAGAAGTDGGTSQACTSSIDEDAQATTDSYRVNNTTNIIRPLTTDGAALDTATFDSFSTNNFRLDWSAADASARYYSWVVVADTASLTQVTKTKTHKYNVVTQITKTNTLKFSVETPITSIKTQKFDVLTPITKTNTLKFNVESKVTNVNTLKFSVDSKVTDTNTLKFSVESKVTDTNIIKFDVLNSVTSVKTLKFSAESKVTDTNILKFNVESKVTDINTIKFNVENYVTKTRTHIFNVLKQIPRTRTHKYNVLKQIPKSRTHKYNVVGFITRLRTHVFSVLSSLSRTRTHKYNILISIQVTKTHKYNVSSSIIQVTTTKTHKFDVSSALTHITKTRTHKYNVIGKVSQIRTHPFSILQPITKTKTHKYNVLKQIILSKTHKFNLVSKVTVAKTHIYNVLAQISRTRTHKYHTEGRVTRTKTHKFNIDAVVGTVTTPKTHKFSVLQRITTTKTHKFSVLKAIVRTRTHKYHVVGLITRSKTHKFNLIQKITKTKTHKYSILVTVPAFTKTHRYAILKLAARTRTHKYNVIGRIYKTKTHRYQMGGKVILTKRHRFIVGSALGELELGGSTFANIRFQDRVRILDIIADINNIAIANIEIPVARPPENLAIAVVGIAEYSSRLLTASAYRPRHRVASTLITPQVIDTIDNLAVAPHIGIEILQPSPQSKVQLSASLQIYRLSSSTLQLQGLTQLAQDKKTKIRIASATMLQQTQETVVESRGQLEIIPNEQLSTQIIAPEIMTKNRAKVIRTLISLLSNDKLFE